MHIDFENNPINFLEFGESRQRIEDSKGMGEMGCNKSPARKLHITHFIKPYRDQVHL